MLPDSRIVELADQYREGKIDGADLSSMFQNGELTKTERRKIVKISSKKKKKSSESLSERQKLRLAAKEKKALPKLSKDERKRKYTQELDSEREIRKSKNLECLGCRKKGHVLKNCPDANRSEVSGHCFRCGSSEHALRNCPKPSSGDELKFAKCFICGETGHLSKSCPENGNGLYPRGGCCHICLQKTHLAKNCPDRDDSEKKKFAEEDAQLGPRIGHVVTENGNEGGDFDDFDDVHANRSSDDDSSTKKNRKKKKKKQKI